MGKGLPARKAEDTFTNRKEMTMKKSVVRSALVILLVLTMVGTSACGKLPFGPRGEASGSETSADSQKDETSQNDSSQETSTETGTESGTESTESGGNDSSEETGTESSTESAERPDPAENHADHHGGAPAGGYSHL